MDRPIVAFGDSYTEGIGAQETESYPAVLERLLSVPVANAGWRGETAEEGLMRFDEDVAARKPRLVIVEFGANEAHRGWPVERAIAGIERILEQLAQSRSPSVIVGVRLAEFGSAWETGLAQLAKNCKAGFVFGVLDGILEDPNLVSDPWHPNARGYEIVARRIEPEVRRMLSI